MKKGKSRTRIARRDILRSNAKNDARKARQQAKSYDRFDYDKPAGSEPLEA